MVQIAAKRAAQYWADPVQATPLAEWQIYSDSFALLEIEKRIIRQAVR